MPHLVPARDRRRIVAPSVPFALLILATLSIPSALLVLSPSVARAAKGDCGQPSSTGSGAKASDALFTLKTAVGSETCELCVCDVSNDNKITAADALKTLKKAVGQEVTLTCPSCEIPLSGVVLIPSGVGSTLSTASLPVAAAVVGLTGLVPASGVTVELFNLTPEGAEVPGPVATTTTNADGSYKFTPAPTPGSQLIVKASTDGGTERAFVTGTQVNVDPASEFVFVSARSAVLGNFPATLETLTLPEIVALTTLLRQADVDFESSATVSAAVYLLEQTSGGVYDNFCNDFTISSGPDVALAGNFHQIALGSAYRRSLVPISGQDPSINTRSIDVFATADPVTIDGSGSVLQTTVTGSGHKLTEVSGATPNPMGPDEGINATATLDNYTTDLDVNASTGTLLASKHGALLLTSAADGSVSAGALASGSNFGVVPFVSRSAGNTDALGGVSFSLRRSSGLSNSSLNGTYSVVQFELELQANSDSFNVHRVIQGRILANTITFDGNGNTSLTAADGKVVTLTKNGPPPTEDPADPDIELSGSDASEDGVDALDYTLTADGKLTIKDGNNIAAVGAVTPDRNIVILRIGDESEGSGTSGIVIGIKRGTGMNNASGSGTYRAMDFAAQMQRDFIPAIQDVSPSFNYRSVNFPASIGTIQLNGMGSVSVQPSVSRSVALEETSYVETHAVPPDVVFDANVAITSRTEAEGDGSETHTYSVASNGVVTVDAADDGGIKGYLSPDGKVFVLPVGDLEDSKYKELGVLIALKQP